MKTTEFHFQIPDTLQGQFRELERRLWWVDTILAVTGVLGCLLISFLLLFISDRFWDTPGMVRLFLSGAGVLGTLYFLSGWIRQWCFRRRDFKSMSGLVQQHYGRLGDRLLGIVELADGTSGQVSPALCEAAIRQVASEAAPMDFRQAVATRRPKIFTVLVLLLLCLVLTPWMLVPEAGWNTLSRWLRPGGTVTRFTFVSLEAMPDRLVVAHGEPFEISCAVGLHPFWKPQWAEARLAGQDGVRVPVLGREVVFPIPAQTVPLEVVLRIGDVSKRISIEPLFRPALKLMQARLILPEYLRHPAKVMDLPHASLDFLEGSQVSFHGLTSRPVVEAQARMAFPDTLAETQPDVLLAEPVEDGFMTDATRLSGAGEAVFTWRDQWGLTSSLPWHLTFRSHTDQAPEIAFPEQPAMVAMLQEEILPIPTLGTDDFGLQMVGMSWFCQKPSGTNLVANGTERVLDGDPQAEVLEGVYQFSPSQLRIPPDVLVTIKALASDYYPGRPRSESATYQIYVLSNEEHARLLQQEFEKVMEALEDLTRRQEALKEAGQELQGMEEDGLPSGEMERKLAEQANEQSALAARLSRLAEQLSNNLKEALRNRNIPTELLEQWAKFAQTMESLSGNEMAQASKALALASTRIPSGQGNSPEASEGLQEALDLEEEALIKLLELQSEIGPALDRMLANTFSQRLRRIAHQEAQIAQALQEILPHTVGLVSIQVPEKYRQQLQSLAHDQGLAHTDSGQLEGEINRFFERTGETDYGTVGAAMKEEKVSAEFLELARKIKSNQAALAMNDTRKWEQRFHEWADLLEKLEEGGGGGGSSGGGEMSDEALRRLLALLRLRQQEQNIRDHTQLLEARRESHQGYREDAIILSIRQMYLQEDVQALLRQGESRYLPQVGQAMEEAETFLTQPRTDQPVVDSETDAVNLLEAEVTDMLELSQGTSLAAAMGMMMQMMGMGPGGSSPGGNMSGGSMDKPTMQLEGDVRGAVGEERRAERTSGSSTRKVPVEYREALQQYHRALEQLESNWPELPRR